MKTMAITRVRLDELEAFFQSEAFRAMPVLPLSTLRAQSYLHNPHARAEDTSLYLAWSGDSIAGFISVVPDVMTYAAESIRIAWLVGLWVDPSHRRKGIALHLFWEVAHDWEGRLLHTNQSPASLVLFKKTSVFGPVKSFQGMRFYRRLDLAQMLPERFPLFQKMRLLLVVIDGVFNLLHDLKWRFFQKKCGDYTAENLPSLDEADWAFIREIRGQKLVRNNPEDWQWVLNYPWADRNKTSKDEAARYPFTCWAPDFMAGPVRLIDSRGEHIAIIWRVRKNGHLRIPYLWHTAEAEEAVAAYLRDLMHQERTSTITVFYPEITARLERWRFYFLHKKPQEMTVYAGKGLLENRDLQPEWLEYGDGDMVFV